MVGIIYHMYVNVKYKNPPTTPTIKLSNQKDIKAIPEELFGKYITGTTFLSLIWILLAFNAIIFSTISCFSFSKSCAFFLLDCMVSSYLAYISCLFCSSLAFRSSSSRFFLSYNSLSSLILFSFSSCSFFLCLSTIILLYCISSFFNSSSPLSFFAFHSHLMSPFHFHFTPSSFSSFSWSAFSYFPLHDEAAPNDKKNSVLHDNRRLLHAVPPAAQRLRVFSCSHPR